MEDNSRTARLSLALCGVVLGITATAGIPGVHFAVILAVAVVPLLFGGTVVVLWLTKAIRRQLHWGGLGVFSWNLVAFVGLPILLLTCGQIAGITFGSQSVTRSTFLALSLYFLCPSLLFGKPHFVAGWVERMKDTLIDPGEPLSDVIFGASPTGKAGVALSIAFWLLISVAVSGVWGEWWRNRKAFRTILVLLGILVLLSLPIYSWHLGWGSWHGHFLWAGAGHWH